jgi:hypothetical protein
MEDNAGEVSDGAGDSASFKIAVVLREDLEPWKRLGGSRTEPDLHRGTTR